MTFLSQQSSKRGEKYKLYFSRVNKELYSHPNKKNILKVFFCRLCVFPPFFYCFSCVFLLEAQSGIMRMTFLLLQQSKWVEKFQTHFSRVIKKIGFHKNKSKKVKNFFSRLCDFSRFWVRYYENGPYVIWFLSHGDVLWK